MSVKKISGTGDRPRLSVFRSLKHIYAQLIDDELGVTLAEASTLSPELKGTVPKGSNVEAAQRVGALIAQKAKQQEIEVAIFDRGRASLSWAHKSSRGSREGRGTEVLTAPQPRF